MSRRGPFEPNLSDRAYILIRNKILKGEYRLGDTLPRRSFAKEFGMSVLPVAAALLRLESDGLVETRPRVGTRVRVPTAEEIRGHYVVREALEAEAAKLFHANATAEERRRARELAEEVDRLYAETESVDASPDVVFEANVRHLELHMYVAECARCKELQRIIENAHILVFNWLYHSSARRPLLKRWHAQLIDALAGSDAAAAEQAMRHHVSYGRGTILRWLQATLVPRGSGLLQSLAAPADKARISPAVQP
ncbi:MAG: GntR family transcriptional regulator [Acidobacteria bacterium]|nr:GntR family transcriptional regulator [Acidobacteriota bacterium]